jgi:hypothetical protein
MLDAATVEYRWVLLLAPAIATSLISTEVRACTISESMETRLPFDAVELSNKDRLLIANIVLDARNWPDVDIQGVAIAGAYVQEKNGEKLKNERGALVRSYLVQPGIQPQNILIEPKTLTDEMVRNTDGTLNLHQIAIELVPLCKGVAHGFATIHE